MAQQLLVRDLGKDAVELQAVDVPAGADPFDLERPEDHVEVPQLGSQELLRLASVLTKAGYQVVSVDVRDSWFRPLDDEQSSELSDLFKSLIKQDLLLTVNVRALLNGRVVNGVTLRDENFRRITIATNGLLFFNPPAASESLGGTFIRNLRKVWREQTSS